MGHYFVQVDGIPDTGGYGDRSQFSVWPQGYTNNPHADIGEPNTATFAESNRWVRMAPGFTRNGVAWSTISSNSAGTNDWTWVDQYLHGGPPLYAGRWANGNLADSNGNEAATAVPNPPASVKVFNIAVDHIGVTTNPSTLFSSPTVDETNTLDSWVQDVATIFSNAAVRYTNSFVYEILNEPNFANVIFPTNQDTYDSEGAYPASLAVGAAVKAIQFVCPTCQTWAPAASGLKNSLALFTNSYVVGGYTDANVISFHQGDALYGAIDAVLAYEGWLPTDSNMDIVASIYGKPFAITEAYPWSPDVLGKTSSWWVTTSPLPTNVPYALWNWQTMTFRFWKNLIESRSAGLSRQQTWLQIYDYDIDAQDPQHIENEGQDAYNGWDVGMEQWDIQGCGPLPTVDGQAMVSWWLTGGASLTNWLSGTTITVTNPAGGYTGTAGLHFWTWQFAGGSTNTFVWADEQITVTTNFGVGLTDIFSNEWTGPIGIEPVIAWRWPGP
jgi:hypothetical protein